MVEELYGLIGRPLGHSLSADYFARKFALAGEVDVRGYRLFELESIDHLPALLAANPALRGLNVTIPYKKAVIPLLDRLSAEAARIGAVNCIKVEADGSLTGHNTDYVGFGESLVEFLEGAHPRALVLGTGGAAQAVCAWLADHDFDFLRVSHSGSGDVGYEELTPAMMADYGLIINTTPLGMSPEVEACPAIPYEALTADHYLFDLVYNPALTEFLRRGQKAGAHICNGMSMFTRQAEASWRIWQAV